MAYGIKYKCDFTSDINGISYSVRILKKDYNSAVTTIRMAGEPISINYTNGSEFKFETIRGSECIINFFADYENQFEEILTSDKGIYRVEVYKNSVFYWGGFVIQDNYSEPFQSVPYQISLRATDGLGDLKNYTLKQVDGGLYAYNMPLIQILLRCLSNLQNGTQLITSIDLFEFGIDRFSGSEDALNSIQVNPYTYLDKDDLTLNCSQIVKSILEIFNAYIFYKDGKYYVERVNYKLQDTLKRSIYNISFNSESTLYPTLADENILATVSKTGVLKFVDADQSITYQTPYKSVRVSNQPGISEPIIVNPFFRQWNTGSTLPLNWVKAGSLNIEKETFTYSGNALKINTINTTDVSTIYSNYLKAEKTLYNSVFSENDTLQVKLAYLGAARIMVKVLTLTGIKYLSSSTVDNVTTYVWSNTQSHLKLYNDVRSSSRPGAPIGSNSGEKYWSTVQETTVNIPYGVFNKVEAYLLPGYAGSYYQVREFQINYKVAEGAKFDTVNYLNKTNKNFTDTYELDTSLGEFDSKFILNQLYLGTGQTQNWYREGKYSEDNGSLGYYTTKSILNQYRKPFKQLSGSFLGQFDFGKVYNIENLTGRHIPLKASMSLKSEYNNIEFYELLTEKEGDIEGDEFYRLIEYGGNYNVLRKQEQRAGRPSR